MNSLGILDQNVQSDKKSSSIDALDRFKIFIQSRMGFNELNKFGTTKKELNTNEKKRRN